ncbi:unnamed protein product [Chilo suppressalis]|uniref:Fatty acyl-CoA reductase n=2 Tax=Chilo suppressalis TaxID=168631 RepID=A0ABN8BAQ0_CHISP|nr:unnamed protein product [Chilo suppressalis]
MEPYKSDEEIKSKLFSPVVNFYTGKSVFITGATGFLGTVLLEKLMFTCAHNIKNIYILIKPTDGQSIDEKMSKFFDSRAFERLREHNPNFRSKIIPLTGDITKKSIGLSENDIFILRKEVSVVFHSAADTSFQLSLSEAIIINTKATEELLKICKDMHQLKAFVYVSTAYSNCNRPIIDEKVYPTDVSLETVYELLEYSKSDKLIEFLFNGRPNAYTYSKALSEELVQNYGNIIPSIIIRPSIITSSIKEPYPGWLSGWNGLNQVILSGMKGYLRCWFADDSCIADTIPVDYIANVMIVSAWDAHERRLKNDKQLKVFNCCSGLQNPIDTGNMMSICLEHNKKHEKDKSKANTMFIIRKNFYVYFFYFLVLHLIPALIIDVFYFLLGREMLMCTNLKKIKRFSSILKVFCFNQFLFIDKNVRRLHQALNETDKVLFDFDVRNIQWRVYLKDFVIALKEYDKTSRTVKI